MKHMLVLLCLLIIASHTFIHVTALNDADMEFRPMKEPGEYYRAAVSVDDAVAGSGRRRRRLAPYQLCLLCKCCSTTTCVTMSCCFGIDCQLPNKPFGVCAFVPKTCSCASCSSP